MKERSTAFCTNCGCKTSYIVKSHLEELTVREITFAYVEHTAYCEQCEEEVYVPEISDENAQSREDAYRKAAKLITVSEINEILEKYSIGAGPLAKVLGFGDITINRYIAGQLPSKSHSEKLLEVRASHKKMEEFLESNKNLISPVAYNKCRTAIDRLNNLYGDSKIEVVARYMLSKSVEITPLALQKMLYYAQAFFQALYIKPLFNDACQAWAHGPVYPDVYYKYREFGYDPIKLPELEFSDELSGLSISEINLLDAVIATFGRYSGTTLKWMTHNEKPWLETRGSLGPTDRCVTVISNDLIKSYFAAIVQQYNIINPCDISRYSDDMAKRQYS